MSRNILSQEVRESDLLDVHIYIFDAVVSLEFFFFAYESFIKRYIWFIDTSLTGSTTLGHSGIVSNDNEGLITRCWELVPHNQMQFSVNLGQLFLEGQTLQLESSIHDLNLTDKLAYFKEKYTIPRGHYLLED